MKNQLNQDLFNSPGPYYTNYPTHGHWKQSVTGDEWEPFAKQFFSNQPSVPLHLYIHVPFCAKLCYYCICNVEITHNVERMRRFTDGIVKELSLYSKFFSDIGTKPNIEEVHFGGGTPAYLPIDQLGRIVEAVKKIIYNKRLTEFAIEIDPRVMRKEDFWTYASWGIDRISFGIQDFDPTVQKYINRVQPYEMVAGLLSNDVRKLFSGGFNFDLLYGLPGQTIEGWKNTLQLTVELEPQRITLLKYAHVPDVKKHMKLIPEDLLPSADTRAEMFVTAVEFFQRNGYEWFGIDNFAKDGDRIIDYKRKRALGRNFGGYTAGVNDMIAIGPTATAALGSGYFQNCYDERDWASKLENDELPIFRGFLLSSDDQLRRHIIFDLICNSQIDVTGTEREYNVNFNSYFSRELDQLKRFEALGLISICERPFTLTEKGRYYARNVAQVFDCYNTNLASYRITGP